MKKNKIYITIAFLLLGIYVYAKNKKPKSSVKAHDPLTQKAYSTINSTVFEFDLITPVYTFRKQIELGILEYDENLPYAKVQFTANNTVKTGYIYNNDIIYK
jgi:hypothetical protein